MRSAQRYLGQVAALLALTTSVGQAFLSPQHPSSFATRRTVDLHSTEKEATDGESEPPTIDGTDATASALTSALTTTKKRKMDLVWCTSEFCKDVVRERVVGDHNQIVLNGPATGQVAYNWNGKPALKKERQFPTTCAVLLLVKPNDEELMQVAAKAVRELTALDIEVLLAPDLAAKLNHYHGVNDNRISLFEPEDFANLVERRADDEDGEWSDDTVSDGLTPFPDLVCTLGGDGLLMYASLMFQGPVPPIISIAGGSLGFLTTFSKDEMVDAVRIALGLVKSKDGPDGSAASSSDELDALAPDTYEPLVKAPHARGSAPGLSYGFGGSICLTIRMRLECSIISREGTVKAKYNVLNEVVIDRGSSPYLAALECFCDDVHLTTVQADGVIFATPTGSTAYSMAAGGSVVHPAVPSILVTPICPHVLSFRSMIFPDHVVLRCYVPEDARTHASVAFDGKYRQELQRGDSVQVQMSTYPVPTINRGDHSSDWLESLKRSFNFNTRPRQRPL